MTNFGIITLTSPFVLSAWLVLLLEKRFKSIFSRKQRVERVTTEALK